MARSARASWKATLFLRLWAFRNIRLLGWVRPRILEMDENACRLLVPLTRRTRNHLGSMYFGALCIGADAAAAMPAFEATRRAGGRWSILFKDLHADFLKRPEGDVEFHFAQGREVEAMLEAAARTGERQHLPIRIVATVPALSGDEPVATFTLTLSAKKK